MTTFERDKIGAQKIKTQFFQDKFYSLNTYLASLRAAKLDTFTHFIFSNLPLCSQSINSLIYVYSLQIPNCFLWVLDHSRDRTSLYYRRRKNFSALPPELSQVQPITWAFHSIKKLEKPPDSWLLKQLSIYLPKQLGIIISKSDFQATIHSDIVYYPIDISPSKWCIERYCHSWPNLTSPNPTKWSNTLKQFVDFWVCLTISWGWPLKD